MCQRETFVFTDFGHQLKKALLFASSVVVKAIDYIGIEKNLLERNQNFIRPLSIQSGTNCIFASALDAD